MFVESVITLARMMLLSLGKFHYVAEATISRVMYLVSIYKLIMCANRVLFPEPVTYNVRNERREVNIY